MRVTQETPVVNDEEHQESDGTTWTSDDRDSTPGGFEEAMDVPPGSNLVIADDADFDRSSIHSSRSAPINQSERFMLEQSMERDSFSSPVRHAGRVRILADGSGFKGW